MKYFKLFILCFILAMPIVHAQTTTVNLKSLKTHYGGNQSGQYYTGNANSHSEFDAMVNLADGGTTLYTSGPIDITSYQGPRGGNHTPYQLWNPPRWGSQRYAIIYSGWFKPNKSGTYRFRTFTDDSHEFMIKGIGKTNDIVTKHYGWNTWAYGTATLDKTVWYEFEYRIQNFGGIGAANFQYEIPANYNTGQFNQLSPSHPFAEWTSTDPNAVPITASGYIKGAEEQGIVGQTVYLKTQNKNQVGFSYTTQATTTTDSNGYYSFNTTLNYNDYDFTIDITPTIGTLTTSDINWFQDRLLSDTVSSKDYWRLDVNNTGSFSASDIYLMHQKRQGNISSYPGGGQEIWNTNSWQNPTIWPAVAADSDDKSQLSGYGAWSLFDLANGNQTTFYVIRAGHKN
jgi:hypothetical protein